MVTGAILVFRIHPALGLKIWIVVISVQYLDIGYEL